MGIFDKLFGETRALKPNVEKMKTKKDVNGLIKALKYNDAKVRYDAATALGELGDLRATEPLIHALMDRFSLLRSRTADALKKITGKDFGYDLKKWQKWWEENKARFLKSNKRKK